VVGTESLKLQPLICNSSKQGKNPPQESRGTRQSK
jgi:hypothetical protein